MYLHLNSHVKISWNLFLLKKVQLSGYCNKITEWVEWLKLPMKEWTLYIKDVVKSLLERIFNVQWFSVLIPLHNGDDETILKIKTNSSINVIKLTLIYAQHILNFTEVLEEEIKIVTSIEHWYHYFNLNCSAQLDKLIPVSQ